MTLSLMEIFETAYDSIGRQPETLSGRDLDTARQTLELLLEDWANDDVNIWKITEGSTAVTASNGDYTIGTTGSPVIDAINISIRDSNNFDRPLEYVSQAEYQRLPNKSQESAPTQYTIFRTTYGVTVKLYPVPQSAYTLIYHTLNYISRPGTYDGSIDLPRKFKPALVYGLTYYLALKNPLQLGPNGEVIRPGVSPEQKNDLKNEYMRIFQRAKDADREKSSFYATPFIGH